MNKKHIIILFIVGLVLLVIGAVSTYQMDRRLSEVNGQLSKEGGSFYSYPDQRNAAEMERDTLAQRIPWAIGTLIVGGVLMAAGPLAVVAERWRAGKLSHVTKRAVVAIVAGGMLAIFAALAAVTMSTRLADVDRSLGELEDKKFSNPSGFDADGWEDFSNLQAEKGTLSGRIPLTFAGIIIGFAAVAAGGYWTWERRKEFVAGPPAQT